jgi:thiol:disulfide interchange protein DsbD
MKYAFWSRKLLHGATFVAAITLIGSAIAADFLDVEHAFKLKVQLKDPATLQFAWTIAPGYKLYRDRMSFAVEGKQAQLAAPALPAGERKFDEGLNKEMEVYHDKVEVTAAIARATAPFVLKLSYQGCADAGLCYPPVDERYSVDPAKPGALTLMSEDDTLPGASTSMATAAVAQDDGSLAQQTLQGGSIWRIGLAFFGFGLLLSLTPCVLPMIPILSSIIVGQGSVTRTRGFLLALAYCLGMALVYTAMGVSAGLAGASFAAALQKPWVLMTFASVLFVLSLSMFDVFQFQLPSSLQSRLSGTSGRQRGGRFAGVFFMGSLSAMIVGPCVAAPLAGALLYISQTGNVWTGGWALFAMAMGMSVPLLLTGVSAGSLLPRTGGWMNGVKRVFGMLLIATAIWMVMPILPNWGAMVAVGAFSILCAVYLRVFDTVHAHTMQGMTGLRFGKSLGLVFLLLGVFELLGAASGGSSVLQPLVHLRINSANTAPLAQQSPQFKRIHSMQELEQELATATKPVMLDFYADWCVSCKEMEHLTFSDQRVSDQMAQFTLLQADVTANNAADRALMKKFSLFGPPALIFFDKGGHEVVNGRVIGYMASQPFLRHLEGTLKL